MKEERVILVDKNNRVVGTEKKIKAHEEGKLHRAFSIFIFNSKGELLLQQRAKTKYHSPLLWSNTVCGHPRPGETYLQAIHRRLKEEMGFDCKLRRCFCFIYKIQLESGLIENEYDCVFVGKFYGKPKPNPKEIMNFKWISLKTLRKEVAKNPERYSPWLKIILKNQKFRAKLNKVSYNEKRSGNYD